MGSMEPTKTRGWKRFLTCLKPDADDDREMGYNWRAAAWSDDYRGGENKRTVKPRSLSAAIKAVFSRRTLSIRKRRTKNHDRSSLKPKRLVDPPIKYFSSKSFWHHEMPRTNSNQSSLLSATPHATSSSTSSSSSISTIYTASERSRRSVPSSSIDTKHALRVPNQEKPNKRGMSTKCCTRVSPTMEEIVVFLICLMALVFGGKVLAIVTCISTCFVFCRDCQRRKQLNVRRFDSPVSDFWEAGELKQKVMVKVVGT